MSGTRFETIRDVSRTLIDLLKNALAPDLTDQIALASPKNAGDNLLTLFLYKVTENPDLKNASADLRPQPDGRVLEQRAPLSLDTYYLLTAHGGESADLFEAHRALSRAMRVFHDNGILRGSLLRAGDPSTGLTSDSILRVTLNPITMEDMTRIWSVFPDTPYEISVSYLVTPVAIESIRDENTAPVLDQIHDQGQVETPLARAGTV
jgi:hypothetical protein